MTFFLSSFLTNGFLFALFSTKSGAKIQRRTFKNKQKVKKLEFFFTFCYFL